MKKNVVLTICSVWFIATAHADPKLSEPSNFGLGLGWQASSLGSGIGFDIHSPEFLSCAKDDQVVRLSAVFDYNRQSIPNFAKDANSEFTESVINNLALGLRVTRYSGDGPFQTYAQAMVFYGMLDDKLSGTNTVGALFSFGADIMFAKNFEGMLGKESSSIFLQADVFLNTKRAELIAGNPRVFPTVAPRIGARMSF